MVAYDSTPIVTQPALEEEVQSKLVVLPSIRILES